MYVCKIQTRPERKLSMIIILQVATWQYRDDKSACGGQCYRNSVAMAKKKKEIQRFSKRLEPFLSRCYYYYLYRGRCLIKVFFFPTLNLYEGAFTISQFLRFFFFFSYISGRNNENMVSSYLTYRGINLQNRNLITLV